jgi:hypothetical protein
MDNVQNCNSYMNVPFVTDLWNLISNKYVFHMKTEVCLREIKETHHSPYQYLTNTNCSNLWLCSLLFRSSGIGITPGSWAETETFVKTLKKFSTILTR